MNLWKNIRPLLESYYTEFRREVTKNNDKFSHYRIC